MPVLSKYEFTWNIVKDDLYQQTMYQLHKNVLRKFN